MMRADDEEEVPGTEREETIEDEDLDEDDADDDDDDFEDNLEDEGYE